MSETAPGSYALPITDKFPRGVLVGTLAGLATFGLALLRQGQLARARHAELGAAVAVLRQQRESDRQEFDDKIADALAAAYRRGLVNGAQQLVADNGRPPLRRVGNSDS